MTESRAFPPVPLRARHDGWTPARQQGFLEALAKLGLVGPAAKAVAMGGDNALSTAIERATEGVVTPVFYRGRQVGERRRFDDRLLLAALRRLPLPAPGDPNALPQSPDRVP